MTETVIAVEAVIFALIGYRIGVYKGHPLAGLILGFVASLLGVVVIALMPQTSEARVKRAERRMRTEQEARRRIEESPNRPASN